MTDREEYEKPKIEIIYWEDDILLAHGHSVDDDDDNLDWDEF